MHLYVRIKQLREEKHFTQVRLAIELEMDQSEYSRFERGARPPSVALLKKLARYHNTSIDYILEETDNRRRYE